MKIQVPFQTLPDYLRPDLNLVLIGINPGLYSVERGHYFARSTSRFWPAFSASRLSEDARVGLGLEKLHPEHDVELPRFGIGLTDLVKRPTANAADLSPHDFEEAAPSLLERIQLYSPCVACFHGVTAYRRFLEFALRAPNNRAACGPQSTVVGSTHLYVVPNPSPANAHFTLADQACWYDKLAEFLTRHRWR